MRDNKKGQVWVETVIYTLIGLVLIGTVLAFAVPFINEQKDRTTIEKSFEVMNSLDNTLTNLKGQGIGNTRDFSFLIGKGTLMIDPIADRIIFELDDSRHEYSESGVRVDVSGTNLWVRTRKDGDLFDVSITLDLSERVDLNYDYIYNDDSGTVTRGYEIKKFDSAPTPYRFILENLGKIPDNTPPCTPINGQCFTELGNLETNNQPQNEGICDPEGFCIPKYTKINIYDAS